MCSKRPGSCAVLRAGASGSGSSSLAGSSPLAAPWIGSPRSGTTRSSGSALPWKIEDKLAILLHQDRAVVVPELGLQELAGRRARDLLDEDDLVREPELRELRREVGDELLLARRLSLLR